MYRLENFIFRIPPGVIAYSIGNKQPTALLIAMAIIGLCTNIRLSRETIQECDGDIR